MLKINVSSYKLLLEILDEAIELADTDNLRLGIQEVIRILGRADIYRNLAVIKFKDRVKIQQMMTVLNRVMQDSDKIEERTDMSVIDIDIILSETLLKLYEE